MEHHFIESVSEYIEFVETRIRDIKSHGLHTFAEFGVKFENDSIAENVKKYFRYGKYDVDIQKCGLGFYDVIINWLADES